MDVGSFMRHTQYTAISPITVFLCSCLSHEHEHPLDISHQCTLGQQLSNSEISCPETLGKRKGVRKRGMSQETGNLRESLVCVRDTLTVLFNTEPVLCKFAKRHSHIHHASLYIMIFYITFPWPSSLAN